MCQTTLQDTEQAFSPSRRVPGLTWLGQPGVEMEVLTHAQASVYGQCDECGCPAFAGEGTYCTRTSCGHHWQSHKRE
jgi:hypothetical protein